MFQDHQFRVKAGGREIECDVLFTYRSLETGKHYMAFTDHTKDRAGNVNVFYASFDPDAEEISMSPIETEQEWVMMRELMAGFSEEVKEHIAKLRRTQE